MLIVWTTLLIPRDQQQLQIIDPRVHFWPRAWTPVEVYNAAIPSEWYISFSHNKYGLIWVLKRPEHSRIVYDR